MSAGRKDVVFEEPPPRRDERYDWTAIAEQLRGRPGEWAKVFDNDKHSLATAIRINGIMALRPDKGFRVRTTNNRPATDDEPRTCTMWLRYEPELDTENKTEGDTGATSGDG